MRILLPVFAALLLAGPVQAQGYNPYADHRNDFRNSGGSVRGYGYSRSNYYGLNEGSGSSDPNAPMFDMVAIADNVGTQVQNAVGPLIPLIFRIALPFMAIMMIFMLIKIFRQST